MSKELNRQAQIRNGLTQYVGSMLTNSDFKGKAAAQLTVAALVEEATKLAKTNDGIDFYVAKPLLRAVIYLYEEDFKRLARDAKNAGLEKEIVPRIRAELDANLKFLRKTVENFAEE